MSIHHIPVKPPNWVLRKIKRTMEYDPKSGNLYWIKNNNPKLIGMVIGSKNKAGYLCVQIKEDGKLCNCYCHHICWFLYYGEWPKRGIDHKRSNKSDNRIKRLRYATHSQNKRNRGPQSNSPLGIPGVTNRSDGIGYQASITFRRRAIYLGSFPQLSDAIKARQQAEIKYFGKWRYHN